MYVTLRNEHRSGRVREFLDKVAALEAEYGLTIEHEDGQGAFEVVSGFTGSFVADAVELATAYGPVEHPRDRAGRLAALWVVNVRT